MKNTLEKMHEIRRKQSTVAYNAYFELTCIASWMAAYIREHPNEPISKRFAESVRIADECYTKMRDFEHEIQDLQDVFQKKVDDMLETMNKAELPFGE